jgi:SulP family sulfate permease
LVYSVEGPLFFGAVENFERTPRHYPYRSAGADHPFTLGTLYRHHRTLEEVIHDLRKRGVRVMLTGANARVKAKLEKAGILQLVGRANLFSSLKEALAVCRRLAETDPALSKGKRTVLSESADAVIRTSRDYFAPNMVQPTEGDR